MAEVLSKYLSLFKKDDKFYRSMGLAAGRVVIILLLSYLLASTLTAVFVDFLGTSAMSPSISTPPVANGEAIKVSHTLNQRELQAKVVERNIFNSEGKVPEESEGGGSGEGAKFDVNAPCRKPTAPIELVGIIYQGANANSLAVIQEKGYSESDVYRKGDTIIGNEQASIYSIDQYRVTINNNGTKECMDLSYGTAFVESSLAKGGGKVSATVPTSDAAAGGAGEGCPSAPYALESTYVEQNLGPGFSVILDQGRLVPHNEDNKMIGFKLIGVKGNSLWRKIGLNTGDIIMSVNDVSMAQPDQGFSIYQALQDDREIRIQYKKDGAAPCNVTVQIK